MFLEGGRAHCSIFSYCTIYSGFGGGDGRIAAPLSTAQYLGVLAGGTGALLHILIYSGFGGGTGALLHILIYSGF